MTTTAAVRRAHDLWPSDEHLGRPTGNKTLRQRPRVTRHHRTSNDRRHCAHQNAKNSVT
jgi:hypothetical protein